MSSSHELDGIRPSNATCTHCGIHMDGVEIMDAKVTCPGCSREVVFELVSPPEPVDHANVATLFGWKSIPDWLFMLLVLSVMVLLDDRGLHWTMEILIACAVGVTAALIVIVPCKLLGIGASSNRNPPASSPPK